MRRSPLSPPLTPTRQLRPAEAAALIGVAPRTLEAWRQRRSDGPAFRRLSPRCIVYDERQLLAWLDERTRTSTSDPGPAPGSRTRCP